MQEETKEKIGYPHQQVQDMSLNDQNTLDLSPEVDLFLIYPFILKVKARLKEEHDKFYTYLNQENFVGLTEVIKFLRECILSKTDPLPGRVVNDMEMLPHLLNLLSDRYAEEEDLQIEVIRLLGNISAGTSQDTQLLVEMNIIPVMTRVLRESFNEDLQKYVLIRIVIFP